MPAPTAAKIIIGDEILSGRTRDANMHHLAGELTGIGVPLVEARFIPDDHDVIVRTVAAMREIATHVFTSGGIGPTHDDITADAIADAFGAPIGVRSDARALLEAHYARTGTELNDARLRMARIPDGAELIDNPVSAAPGFRLGNVFVMAGVPSVFQAMVASVLPKLTGGIPLTSRSLRINRGEGDIAGPLGRIAEDHPELSLGSYPFLSNGVYGAHIVVRGTDGAAVDAAVSLLKAAFPDDAVE